MVEVPHRGWTRGARLGYKLLDAAYAALGRDVLRSVLWTHRENRELPAVDVLEAEYSNGAT